MYREQDIPFVFEHGVLRPEAAVNWPEGARGIARIREVESVNRADRDSHQAALRAVRQISESRVFNSGGVKLTRDQMHERG